MSTFFTCTKGRDTPKKTQESWAKAAVPVTIELRHGDGSYHWARVVLGTFLGS